MINLRNQKFWLIIFAVILLAAFSAILFHHHEHGDGHDCAVCRLAQQMVCFAGLFLAVLLLVKPQGERFFETSRELVLFLFFSDLSGRAPPFADAKGQNVRTKKVLYVLAF